MDDSFKEFLLREYEEVAGAHFKTLESISAFFKNYIVIMSLPAAIFSYFFSKDNFSNFNYLLLSIAFLAFSIIGMGVCLYVINLRLDAILYARTVNGIRRFFYNSAEIDTLQKIKIRTLPASTLTPAYHDCWNFWPVLLVFAIFDGVYASIGSIFLFAFSLGVAQEEGLNEIIAGTYAVPISVFILVVVAHVLFFKELAWYREFGYLKSNIIGIDVDGVLNKHREHFCQILSRFGVSILPENITHIPIHEIPNLNPPVSRANEIGVFNSPEYWMEMPQREQAADNVKKLANSLGFKIYIFTYRPWPDSTNLSGAPAKQLLSDWQQKTLEYIHSIPQKKKRYFEIIKYYLYYRHSEGAIINQVSRLWLDMLGFKYDKLIVEKGNENILSKRTRIKNRIALSGRKNIKFFIEDDLEKAVKLAYICDLVYLIDHPYNQSVEELPSNLIRVTEWIDIFRHIRKAT